MANPRGRMLDFQQHVADPAAKHLKAAYGSSGAFGLSVLMLRQGSIILMLISTIFALTLCIGFRLELEPQIRIRIVTFTASQGIDTSTYKVAI
ncbi:hypothetical protein Pdw03_5326 [Penicillium digitatum]|uniref:Uncharacterized protein n=1 Tax=Penicillium digitatum TaxID=36651 RepID=A0A7T7BQ24_PENDI|nr:hypothetical protein Pdw03_5326 [Penicillium digitatum]